MLLFVILIVLMKITWCSHIGSTLFNKRLARTECWSEEDIARLRARRIFENIIPTSVTPDKVNDDYIKETLRYFRKALKTVDTNIDKGTGTILKEVLADTIGAHMRSEILPTVRFAYYAGYVPYRRVRELHDFFAELKIYLNTQGLGWKKPRSVAELSNFTVEKIRIGPGKYVDPCIGLVIKRDSKSCIHLPALKTDDTFQPSAIELPFKSGGLNSLVSPTSKNVLLKFYTTASRCILHDSPESCRHSDFVNFNNELWHWMKRDVAPHLVDEKLYAAYGGVLRVAAAVQNYGKDLSRRNLFEYQDAGVSKWHPWKALTQSYIYINTDWTPYLYVVVVLMMGLAICLLQICYSFILGDGDGCHCKGNANRPSSSKSIAYAKIDSNIPAMLPSHDSVVHYSDQRRVKKSTPRTKSSFGSVKTQKVYDLNENAEKLMAVIMSSNEDTSEEINPPKCGNNRNIIDVGQTERSKSPPKIDTPVTQIQRRTPIARTQIPMYSTSTATHSVATYQGIQETDSWSGTGSSTSAQSITSSGSKSRCRRSKSSRDLAWARRVVSKHSLHAKSTSGTELDVHSYTTPQSQR